MSERHRKNFHAFVLAAVQCGCTSAGARVGLQRTEVGCMPHLHAASACMQLHAACLTHNQYTISGHLRRDLASVRELRVLVSMKSEELYMQHMCIVQYWCLLAAAV
jgi:hypothetical protein